MRDDFWKDDSQGELLDGRDYFIHDPNGNKYKLVTLLKRETEEIIGRTVLGKENFI